MPWVAEKKGDSKGVLEEGVTTWDCQNELAGVWSVSLSAKIQKANKINKNGKQ